MALLIGFIGLLTIGFIVWWFWLSQPRAYAGQVNDVIEIKVKDGVYQPDLIQVPLLRCPFIFSQIHLWLCL